MSAGTGETYTIPGPYGPGYPTYEIGHRHGRLHRPAVMRDDETYMNGWADGYETTRSPLMDALIDTIARYRREAWPRSRR